MHLLLISCIVLILGSSSAHEFRCGHSVTQHRIEKLVKLHNEKRDKTQALHRHYHETVSSHANHKHGIHRHESEEGCRGQESSHHDSLGQANIHDRKLLQDSAVASFIPIRIHVEFQGISNLELREQIRLKTVISATKQTLQKYLGVINATATSRLLPSPYCDVVNPALANVCDQYFPDFSPGSPPYRRMCHLATLNPAHILDPTTCVSESSYVNGSCRSYSGTAGELTDIYMYVTASDSECSSGVAAFAHPCHLDFQSDRPVIGAVNICPIALSSSSTAGLTAIVAHEFVHALGFTSSLFRKLHHSNGTLRQYEDVVQTVAIGNRSVNRLITPSIRAAARKHFNCSSLGGAQLEAEGGSGSANSHWEYNLFQGELMVASGTFGAAGQGPVMSPLTLAYFRDSGWYNVNDDLAGHLSWGHGAGCQLPESSCQSYMASTPSQNLFCDAMASTADEYRCTPGLMSSGVCKAMTFSDGCGLLLSQDAAETCLDSTYVLDQPEAFGWANGKSSRCMPLTFMISSVYGHYKYSYPSSGHEGQRGAACFSTVCASTPSGGFTYSLSLTFGDNQTFSLNCPEGQTLDLKKVLPTRFKGGTLGPCPSAAQVCESQVCSGRCNRAGGQCVDGKCLCRLTYSGEDCGLDLVLNKNVTDEGSVLEPAAAEPVWVSQVVMQVGFQNSLAEVNVRASALMVAVANWADVAVSTVNVTNITSTSDVISVSARSSGIRSGNSGDNVSGKNNYYVGNDGATAEAVSASAVVETASAQDPVDALEAQEGSRGLKSAVPASVPAPVSLAVVAGDDDDGDDDFISEGDGAESGKTQASTSSASPGALTVVTDDPEVEAEGNLVVADPVSTRLLCRISNSVQVVIGNRLLSRLGFRISPQQAFHRRGLLTSGSEHPPLAFYLSTADQSETTQVLVTIQLTMSNSSHTLRTISQLNDSSAIASLANALDEKGLHYVNGSLLVSTHLERSGVPSTPSSPPVTDNVHKDAAESHRKSIIVIVVAVVAAAIGFVAVIIAVTVAFVLLRRRTRLLQALQEHAAAEDGCRRAAVGAGDHPYSPAPDAGPSAYRQANRGDKQNARPVDRSGGAPRGGLNAAYEQTARSSKGPLLRDGDSGGGEDGWLAAGEASQAKELRYVAVVAARDHGGAAPHTRPPPAYNLAADASSAPFLSSPTRAPPTPTPQREPKDGQRRR